MINTKQFRHIRTFQDIKLEKARLRYEMLLAENSLTAGLSAIQGLLTLTGFLSRFSEGFSYAQNFVFRIRQTFGWIFRKRKKSDRESNRE
ncbi:MAG: hypothetical protein R6U86_02835 [Bacteroidales bacterium]